jgi:DNA repair protein RadC
MDRPREKLQRKGPAALSDFELLEVLIGSGSKDADVGQIARQVQKVLRRGTQALNYESLTALHGVNTAHASRVLSALELAKRHLVRDVQPLRNYSDVLQRLADIRQKQQEHFVVLSLDGGRRLIAQRTVTIGTLNVVLAHPREVFSDPITDRAASVIVAHNHPSGNKHPSRKDIELTQYLHMASQMIGIPLLDHIIVTKTEDYSLHQNHYI